MKKMVFISILLLLGLVPYSMGQQRVTGNVKDAGTGDPIPGATIMVEGTSTGTITDMDGNYSIAAEDGDVLLFSFIGMATQKKTVNGATLYVSMKPDDIVLNEVVAIGYGSVRKKDLTGSVVQVGAEEITKSNATDVTQALQGRAAGVQITSADGAPGSGISIQIRGASTLTGGSEPLIVIDGVAMPPSDGGDVNPLLGINPNDIESFDVLKDAASTAIYGAQGANGVILITTKSGEEGKARVAVNARYGMSKINNNVDYLSPLEYAQKEKQRQLSKAAEDGNVVKNTYWDDVINKYYPANPDRYESYLDKLSQTATDYELNMSMSGGGKGLSYMASFGLTDQEGVIKTTGLKRITTRLNLKQEVNKWLKLGTNISLSHSKINGLMQDYGFNGITSRAVVTNPFLPLFQDGTLVPDSDDDLLNTEDALFYNDPMTYLSGVDVDKKITNTMGKLYADINLVKGLVFHSHFSANLTQKNYRDFYSKDSYRGTRNNGENHFKNWYTLNYTYEANLTYKKKIGKHNFTALALFEQKKWRNEQMTLDETDYQADLLRYYSFGNGALKTINPGYGGRAWRSYAGRLNYSYMGRYLMQATYRYDGSSKFGEDNQWAGFPSVSAGWRASEESFMDFSNEWLSNLKVRASWGLSGNDQVGDYLMYSTFNSGLVALGIDEKSYPTAAPSQVGNSSLKWETTEQIDLGIDIGLFNSKVNLVFDWYRKHTYDMLFDVTPPASSGYDEVTANLGELEIMGFDFDVNAQIIQKPNFGWSANVNFYTYQSEILDLGGAAEAYLQRNVANKSNDEVVLRVGDEIGTFYGVGVAGVPGNRIELLNSPQGAELGKHLIVDADLDGISSASDDLFIVARTQPKFAGGFGSTFTFFKNFDLYAFFNYKYGNDLINTNISRSGDMLNNKNLPEAAYYSIWSQDYPYREGDMILNSIDVSRSTMNSTFVEDGSYIRFSNLSLGYTIPQKYLGKLGIGSAKLSVAANNLYTWTRYSWYTPEVNSVTTNNQDQKGAKVGQGVDKNGYPRSRSVVFKLNITL